MNADAAFAECGYVRAGGSRCRATPAVRYLNGTRCAEHSPAALAGHAEVVPDPARTVAGLRAAAALRAEQRLRDHRRDSLSTPTDVASDISEPHDQGRVRR